VNEHLELVDWRRQVVGLYAAARTGSDDPAGAVDAFRAGRDRLFASHPQSPLPPAQRASFAGLSYWPYDPRFRLAARLEPDMAAVDDLPVSIGEAPAVTRLGWVSGDLPDGSVRLAVFWLAGYGGGLFVPFRDATCGTETYGGGRYLLDTVKGSDLGMDGDALILDFNYAYHPSCAYDPHWSCPLAPSENWLPFPVRAGERLGDGSH